MHWRGYSVDGGFKSPRAFVNDRVRVEFRVLNNRTEDFDDLFPLLDEQLRVRVVSRGDAVLADVPAPDHQPLDEIDRNLVGTEVLIVDATCEVLDEVFVDRVGVTQVEKLFLVGLAILDLLVDDLTQILVGEHVRVCVAHRLLVHRSLNGHRNAVQVASVVEHHAQTHDRASFA